MTAMRFSDKVCLLVSSTKLDFVISSVARFRLLDCPIALWFNPADQFEAWPSNEVEIELGAKHQQLVPLLCPSFQPPSFPLTPPPRSQSYPSISTLDTKYKQFVHLIQFPKHGAVPAMRFYVKTRLLHTSHFTYQSWGPAIRYRFLPAEARIAQEGVRLAYSHTIQCT